MVPDSLGETQADRAWHLLPKSPSNKVCRNRLNWHQKLRPVAEPRPVGEAAAMAWSVVFCVREAVQLRLSSTQNIPDAQDYTNHQDMSGCPCCHIVL